MSEALDKAKAAVLAAKLLLDATEIDHTGTLPLAEDLEFGRLMRVAHVQAVIAIASAVETYLTERTPTWTPSSSPQKPCNTPR